MAGKLRARGVNVLSAATMARCIGCVHQTRLRLSAQAGIAPDRTLPVRSRRQA